MLYQTAPPFNALPAAIGNALHETCTVTGAPPEIVMLLALSSMTISVRDFAVMAPTDNTVMSTQIFCMGIADKQSGKGRAYNLLFKAISDFDTYLANLSSGDASGPANGLSDIVINEASLPAVYEALEGESNQIALIDLDAEAFLKGDVMRDGSRLNQFFDSPGKMSKRLASRRRLLALNPTLAICLMAQRDVYLDHLRRRGASEYTIGLHDRMVFAVAEASSFRRAMEIPTPALTLLQEAELALLMRGQRRRHAGNYSREILPFDAAGPTLWDQIQSRADARFRNEPAPRVAEKAWRFASAIHALMTAIDRLLTGGDMDDPFPPIPAQTLELAWQVVEWTLCESYKVRKMLEFATRPKSKVVDRRIEEARAAHQFLLSYLGQMRCAQLPMRKARQVSGLTRHKFEFLIEHFAASGLLYVMEDRNIVFLPPFFHGTGSPGVSTPPQIGPSMPYGYIGQCI